MTQAGQQGDLCHLVVQIVSLVSHHIVPIPRYYRQFCPHYHGFPAIPIPMQLSNSVCPSIFDIYLTDVSVYTRDRRRKHLLQL